MMTNIELANKLKDIAKNYKTLYILGCFGAPMTESNKKRYTSNYDYNKQASRKKVNQKDDYDAIADEILRLRDQRRQAEVDSVIKDEQMKQIRELQDFVKKQPSTITEFDETLVSRLIEKITVFEDHFTVDFKSGITIDIKA